VLDSVTQSSSNPAQCSASFEALPRLKLPLGLEPSTYLEV